jgi:hypothetical protein
LGVGVGVGVGLGLGLGLRLELGVGAGAGLGLGLGVGVWGGMGQQRPRKTHLNGTVGVGSAVHGGTPPGPAAAQRPVPSLASPDPGPPARPLLHLVVLRGVRWRHPCLPIKAPSHLPIKAPARLLPFPTLWPCQASAPSDVAINCDSGKTE